MISKRMIHEKQFWDKTPPTNIRGRPLTEDLMHW